MAHASKPFSSSHFIIEELEEGVFSVLGEHEGLRHSNAAIVDLGDQTLVLDDFTATCEAEEDPSNRAAIDINLARYQALYKDLATLRIVQPNAMFEGALTLKGAKRTVELIGVARAHTVSDVYLRLPDEGPCFMGDLGFFDTIPFLGFADPLRWVDVLREFDASDMKIFVPGHGAVGGVAKIELERECIEAVVTAIRGVLEAEQEITSVLADRLPEPFRTWEKHGGRYNLMNHAAVAKAIALD